MDMILVKGPANKIPDSITIDLTGKEPDFRLNVGDLELEEGLELITDPDENLIIISESTTSQDLVDDEEETDEEVDVEVPVVDEEEEEEE